MRRLVVMKHLPLLNLLFFILVIIVRIVIRIITDTARHRRISAKARLSNFQIGLVQPEVAHHPV